MDSEQESDDPDSPVPSVSPKPRRGKAAAKPGKAGAKPGKAAAKPGKAAAKPGKVASKERKAPVIPPQTLMEKQVQCVSLTSVRSPLLVRAF